MNARKIFTQTSIVAAAVLCAAGLQAWAFTEPSGTPPLADVSAPINVGATSQDKSGGGNAWITADGLGSRYGALLATVSGSVSIGTTSNAGTLNIASPTGGTATLCLNGSCTASVGGVTGGSGSGAEFELLTSSGTWKPPSATATYNYIIVCIGGGGGGGGTSATSQYNSPFATDGGDGSTTSFGSLCAAGGGTHSPANFGTGQVGYYNSGGAGGHGGAGGFGGGGGAMMPAAGSGAPGQGGAGLDYTGGMGGPFQTGYYGQGTSAYLIPNTAATQSTVSGSPATGGGGLGGDPSFAAIFQWIGSTGCGRGGKGGDMIPNSTGAAGGGGSGRIMTVTGSNLSGNQTVTIGGGGSAGQAGANSSEGQLATSGTAGRAGCIGIWYWPVR